MAKRNAAKKPEAKPSSVPAKAVEVRFLAKHGQPAEVWPAGVVFGVAQLDSHGGVKLLDAAGDLVAVYPPDTVCRVTPLTPRVEAKDDESEQSAEKQEASEDEKEEEAPEELAH